MIMSVREAVSFTDARKDVSVGLAICPVPLVGLAGQDSYVPEWNMKDGLLRLVRDIRELPKDLVGFVCLTLSLRRKSLTGETMGECTVR